MMKFYYRMPDGMPTTDLASLIPAVINPQFLSASELLEYNVAECVVTQPSTDWWQRLGDKIVNDSGSVHQITWEVIDKDLEDVKIIAWDRIKERCEEAKKEGFDYTFPGDVEGHVDVGHEDMVKILSLHAMATTFILQDNMTAELPWTDTNGTIHVLSPEEAVSFAMEAFTLCSQNELTSQSIRENIDNATTVAEVVSASVWPGDE